MDTAKNIFCQAIATILMGCAFKASIHFLIRGALFGERVHALLIFVATRILEEGPRQW